jgi:hypothetical protein
MTSVIRALLVTLLGAQTSVEAPKGVAIASTTTSATPGPLTSATTAVQVAVVTAAPAAVTTAAASSPAEPSSAAGPTVLGPTTAISPAPLDGRKALELVVVGGDDERNTMEALLQGVLGARRDITWTMRASATVEEMLRSAPDGHARFWVDLAQPGHIRLVLPAPDDVATSAVRSVETGPESGSATETDPGAVGREKAAQIVIAAIRAYGISTADLRVAPQSVPVTTSSPVTAIAADAEPASKPAAVAVAQAAPALRVHPRSARNPEDENLPAWHSLAAAAGTHTSPLNVAEPYGQSHWLGPSFALSYRYTKPQRYLGASISADFSERSIDSIDLTSQFWTLAFQGGRSFAWRDIWFFLGVSAGALVLRQDTTATGSASYLYSLPNQLGVTWSAGGVFALGGHVQVPFGETLLLDIGVAAPFIFLPRVQKDYGSGTFAALTTYIQGLIGVVVRL